MKSLTRSLLLALAITTGAWVPVQAQTFEQSFAAYQRKDYRTAFVGFQKLAEQGDAIAPRGIMVKLNVNPMSTRTPRSKGRARQGDD